ncbi:iron-containing redox enzyme family protein [Pseudomonas sp. H22_DOA]|nr:iron-containing redox enzyme family protein [Pseudomonas sp. H22_DOA]
MGITGASASFANPGTVASCRVQPVDHPLQGHLPVSVNCLLASATEWAIKRGYEGVTALCRSPQRRLFQRFGLTSITTDSCISNNAHAAITGCSQRNGRRSSQPYNNPPTPPSIHRRVTMTAHASFEQQLSLLDERIENVWADILDNSRLVKAIRGGGVSKALYAIYMIETFHYTAHNARNQGLVGVRHADNPVYAKFCFEHAAQEVGHEKMALHDVMSLGLKNEAFDIPTALPATEVLIAYLYWISFTGNPLQRLEYSYWAENAYQFINPLINSLSETLSLKPAQLTFFIAHSDIDVEHFNEIKLILQRTCKDQSDWDAVATVMETSLRLTGNMLEAVYEQYEAWQNGLAPRYDFLHALDNS